MLEVRTQVKRRTVKAILDISFTVLLMLLMLLVVFSGNCIGALVR